MFSLADTPKSPSHADVWDSLLQLQANTPDALLKQRTERRIVIRVGVIAKPGDSSRRHSEEITGVTGDVSTHGCQLIFDRPIWVGDIFWLTFDRQQLDIPPQMGRALRCAMLGEEQFETGFMFLESIDLSNVQ